MRKTLVVLFAMLLLLVGCSTAHLSPHQAAVGNKLIYVTNDEDRVFSEVYSVILERFPDDPITEINAAIRGYSVHYTFLADYTDYTFRVFPATATIQENTINGYYVEVSAKGTIMGVSSNAKKLYNSIQTRLSTFAKATYVNAILPGKYIKERDEFRLTTASSLREGGTLTIKQSGSGIADELVKLNNLRKQGVLTEEEYQKVKKALLTQ